MPYGSSFSGKQHRWVNVLARKSFCTALDIARLVCMFKTGTEVYLNASSSISTLQSAEQQLCCLQRKLLDTGAAELGTTVQESGIYLSQLCI